MRSIAFAVAAMVAVSPPLLAQEASFADGKLYLGLEGGMVLPRDVDVSAATSANGVTVTGSGSLEFDNGFSLAGVAGYRFTDLITAEAELGYSKVDYDSVTGTLTVSDGTNTANVNGTADVEGDLTALVGMANVLLTPKLDRAERIKPFVGVGLGFVSYDDEITSIGGTAVSASDDDTALAYQLKLGFDVAATEQVDFGASYSYWVADTDTEYTDDFAAHRLLLRAVYRF